MVILQESHWNKRMLCTVRCHFAPVEILSSTSLPTGFTRTRKANWSDFKSDRWKCLSHCVTNTSLFFKPLSSSFFFSLSCLKLYIKNWERIFAVKKVYLNKFGVIFKEKLVTFNKMTVNQKRRGHAAQLRRQQKKNHFQDDYSFEMMRLNLEASSDQ